jgi:hypothetical protein
MRQAEPGSLAVQTRVPLLPAVTTSRRFITQEWWLISVEQVFSFQAAIIPTLSSILSGEGLDENEQG